MSRVQELREFKSSYQRWERYRLAGKSLKFNVYLIMEKYTVLSFFLFLASLWIDGGPVKAAFLHNALLVAVVGVAHHGRLVITKPWLLLAAAFEALIIWAGHKWLLSNYFILPDFWAFCIFIFALRFWQKGEREINMTAFNNSR